MQATLLDIGKLIAIDACFNNAERFPALWKGADRMSNFVFKVDAGTEFDAVEPNNLEFKGTGVAASDC